MDLQPDRLRRVGLLAERGVNRRRKVLEIEPDSAGDPDGEAGAVDGEPVPAAEGDGGPPATVFP
jgi:hypothetical protein